MGRLLSNLIAKGKITYHVCIIVIDELDWVGCRQVVALWKVSVVLSIRILWSSIEVILSLLTVVGSIGPRVAWSVLLELSIWVWISVPFWVEASLSVGCLVVLVSISGLLTEILVILRPKFRSSSFIVIMSEDCAAFLIISCLWPFNLIIIGFSFAVQKSVSISSAVWTESDHILSWFVISVCRSRVRLGDLVHLLFFE